MTRSLPIAAAIIAAYLTHAPELALFRDIERTTDVAFLERLCVDRLYAEQEYARRGGNVAGVKGNRSAAYVRLGALATPDSLAAVARVEARMHHQNVAPRPAVPASPDDHPAPHMGDSIWRPLAQLRLSDNRVVAAYVRNSYGPPALFIALQSQGTWSPAVPVPSAMPYEPPRLALVELPLGRLRVEVTAVDWQGNLLARPATPDALEFTLAEVARDRDGDGWTDIAETQLRMDSLLRDTDRDGIPDDRDAAPALQAPATVPPEDAQMLRRAVFAMFGLTDSALPLFVADDSARLQFDNLPGPVLYHDAYGGVRVTWKIVEKTADAATVYLTDFEGALAASSNDVLLKKVGGQWYVVAIKLKSIS